MPVNDTIREADYNSIRNKLVNIIGTGSGTSGWGQTLISSAVVVGNRVTITEWGNLRFDIINAYKHIFGINPVTVQPAVGNTVRYSNTFVPNTTTDAPITQYDTYADTIIADRFTVHPSQSATFSWTPASTVWPGIYGSFWNTRLSTTVTATWPSAAAARHFFNSGGEIRLASSRTGGSTTQQCNAWTTLLTSAGTRAFGGNIPATGTSPSNGQNWFRLTNAYQQWYSIASTTPYGGNSYRIFARTPGVANNASGTAATTEFFVEWIDNYVDPGDFPGDSPNTIDAVDGTFSLSVSHLFATGVLEPPGSGNFTVTQPSVSIGAIAPDSLAALTPSFILSRSATSVNEGGSFTITFNTNQAGSFAYTITGVASADIGGASLTGNVSNGSVLTYNVTADNATEGTDTFTFSLNNGQASTAVNINDTSVTPTYALARSRVTVNEGASFTITFSTNQPGSFAYTITGVASADIGGASLTGSVSNGSVLTYNVTADNATEGTETFTFSLNNGQASIPVTINDTSYPGAPPLPPPA
jgi:hypothetical protein